MKKIAIYEPAMCCPTGLCGVSVDPELLRISTVVTNLRKSGIPMNRYNLTSAPQKFVQNQTVNDLMMKEGVEILPVTVVDGEIVKTKGYPSNTELATLLDISEAALGKEEKQEEQGCGCADGRC